jgi:hypothetical protein
LLVGFARPAAAAVPCWKSLLNDWYDGRIDNTYPIYCYTEALRQLKPDVLIYSSAHDDIERALQSAIENEHRLGKTVTPTTPVAPPTTPVKVRRPTETFVHSPPDAVRTRPTRKPAPAPVLAVDKVVSGSGDVLPLPVLLAGALAGLLLAAGLGGVVVKRVRGSRSS